MAKKRSSRTTVRRDTSSIANRRLPHRLDMPRSNRVNSLYEDRRLFHPEGVTAPARSYSRTRHRLVLSRVSPPLSSHARPRGLYSPVFRSGLPAFKTPDRVLVCVRRSTRKEVIHALGKAGKVGQRRPRRSEYSSISCK